MSISCLFFQTIKRSNKPLEKSLKGIKHLQGDHPKETIEPAAKSASGGSSNTSSDVFPNSSDASPDSSLRAKAAQKLRRKAKREQKKKKPKTLLIPFVEEIVPVVDIEAGRIEITPPPGLMDL